MTVSLDSLDDATFRAMNDVDYPVHRTFRWARHLDLSLGGPTAHLRRLGRLLATA